MCVWVCVCSLSFKFCCITGNHRQIAGVKVPADVKPFRKHTQCIQVTMNKLGGMSDPGLEWECCCFALKVGHVTQYHISGIASTLALSQTLFHFRLHFGWSVSQPASQLIHPCQGQIVGYRSCYLRHISDTALWFQGIVLSQMLQNQVSLAGSGCTGNHRGGSTFSVHIC